MKKAKRAVMAKAKQPKSIKSPAGKKARKATAAYINSELVLVFG